MRCAAIGLLCIATAVLAAEVPSPLPHEAGGVALGAERGVVEATLGRLDCHDNAGGFRVCSLADATKAPVSQLELFFYGDHVVSIAYAEKLPANAWDFLDSRIQQYGKPALSSRRERDKAGRTHEVFGWKDEQTIYSLRFVWSESSELAQAISTIWDRARYREWENAAGASENGKQEMENRKPRTGQ